MLSEAVRSVLPPAAAVMLSPIPIVAIVVILSTPRARWNGPAFLLGWVLGLAAVSGVVVALAAGASDPDSEQGIAVGALTLLLGVAFLAMALRQWQKRPRAGEDPKRPKWMATLDRVQPGRALGLGVALSAANPKNLALSAAAAASIAQAGLDTPDTVIAVAAFVVIGSLSVGGAVLAHALLGHRSDAPLARLQHFMAANNAVIMMVILVLLGAKFVGDGIATLAR